MLSSSSGDRDLADVVEDRAVGHRGQLVAAQPNVRGQAGRAIGQAPAVAVDRRVLGLHRVGQRGHDRVRLFLAVRQLADAQRAVDACQQLVALDRLAEEVHGAGIDHRDHLAPRATLGQRQDGGRGGARMRTQLPCRRPACPCGSG